AGRGHIPRCARHGLRLSGLPHRRPGRYPRSLLPHPAAPAGRRLLLLRALFPPMSRVFAWIELLRPRQWVKNAFVLVGLVFGHAWLYAAMVSAALCATLAFCLASGAIYALNDARDAEQDRRHPDKCSRPVARGAVSPGEAAVIFGIIAACAIILAAWVDWRVAAIVAAYLALSGAYSMGLKQVPVLDVVIIAAGFMLRLLAGTLGIGIEPSNWLLACGFLLTLFLGFAKRRAEIAGLAED